MGRGAWWAAFHRVTKSWAHSATEHTHTCNIQRCRACPLVYFSVLSMYSVYSLQSHSRRHHLHSHWCLGSGWPVKPKRTNETVPLVSIWTWKAKMSWFPAGDLIIGCVNSEALTFSPLAINLREQMSAEKQWWSRQADNRDEGEGGELEKVLTFLVSSTDIFFVKFSFTLFLLFNFWKHMRKTAFPCGSSGKQSTCNTGDLGSIPGSGRSAGEGIGYPLQYSWASLVAQMVKNPPAMWETWVWCWEDPLEKGNATHPVFWPGEFYGLYSPWDCKKSDTTECKNLDLKCMRRISIHSSLSVW